MGTETRWLRKLWRMWGSIRLAAALLFALLVASVVASLYPQMPDDPSLRELWLAAVKVRYGPLAGLWRGLGLFEVQRSPLYLALLGALLLNTLACTVQRILSLVQSLTRAPAVIRSTVFFEKAASRAQWPVARREDAVDHIQEGLARRGYRVCVAREAMCAHVYAEQGKWGGLGSPISHVAAIVFFLALLVRSAFWPAIVALSLFLVATLVSLWMPHRRLWLCVDAERVRMAGIGDYGHGFDRLVEMLSETCREARAGGDG